MAQALYELPTFLTTSEPLLDEVVVCFPHGFNIDASNMTQKGVYGILSEA